jgi:hypothetical protein
MNDEYITREEAEVLFVDYEKSLRQFRDKMLRVDEQMPGLSTEDRAALIKLVRDTLTELATMDHVAPSIRQEWPDLAERFDQVAKALLPEEQWAV